MDAILQAIDAVTRREDEDYETFVRRAGGNEIGRRVKLADLADNLELARIKTPGPKDHERMERYRKARDILLA